MSGTLRKQLGDLKIGKPETNLDRKIELIVPCFYIPMKVGLMRFFFLYNLCLELDSTINRSWTGSGKKTGNGFVP